MFLRTSFAPRTPETFGTAMQTPNPLILSKEKPSPKGGLSLTLSFLCCFVLLDIPPMDVSLHCPKHSHIFCEKLVRWDFELIRYVGKPEMHGLLTQRIYFFASPASTVS